MRVHLQLPGTCFQPQVEGSIIWQKDTQTEPQALFLCGARPHQNYIGQYLYQSIKAERSSKPYCT